MSAVIVASIVLCSWSVMFRSWMSRTDTRWLLSLQLLLLLLATTITNPYLALTVIWITIHPWIVNFFFNKGYLECSPEGSSTYTPLTPILWWTAAYVIITHYPVHFTVIAYTLILWASLNAIVGLYEDGAKSLPHWFEDKRSSTTPNAPGLLGGSFALSFVCASGFLSCILLMATSTDSRLTVGLGAVAAFLIFSSFRTGTLSPLVFASTVLVLWYVRHPYYLIIGGVLFILIALAKLTHPAHAASLATRLPSWIEAIKVSYKTYFIGIGLGMWNALTNPPEPVEARDANWRNLHNDYVQAWVELGPIPVICAILFLATSWANLYYSTPSPQQLFGLLMTSYIALYAFVYFPMRDHMPALLLAVSMSMLNG